MPVKYTKPRKRGGVANIIISFIAKKLKTRLKPLKAHYFWGVFSFKSYYYVELLQLARLLIVNQV